MIKRHTVELVDFDSEEDAIEDADLFKLSGQNRALELQDGEILGGHISTYYDAFSVGFFLKLETIQCFEYLKLMADFGSASFDCILNNGKLFSFTIDGENYEMMGSHHSSYTDAHKWLDCIYAAIAVRNEEAISILMQVPNTVFDKASKKVDPINYALVDVYKGLFGGITDRSMLELISHAYSVADSDDAGRLDFIMTIFMPQLGIIRSILSEESEEEYNELMHDAVLKHKQRWSSGEREYRYAGWVSLPLIALASIAFDHKGYRLNFETDYIPRWLVEREFS
ncbi:MAG: immunity 49 family protein [Pseudomonadota bacterium]|nr:immunity 49 family protein [Pseudomonadota bacterium]